MKTFTLTLPHNRINQSIRDALGLDISRTHGSWIIAAPTITFAVHVLRKRGFLDLPSNGHGLVKAKGETADALTAAGLLNEQIAVVCGNAEPGTLVAVVEEGGTARRIGLITSGKYVPDNLNLTCPEQAAMDVWLRGSSDTTGMLTAVRHALAASGPTVAPDARERLARHLYMRGSALEAEAGQRWDAGDVPAGRVAEYHKAADQILRIITGKDH